ncbi:hypothetical protein [Escherichia coli]|uniref:hypothetical protein n=1 Tax=Escherichia coli TaxID=562 RepID=UPI0013C2B9D5|nr:hypothetical protein [Escherichia coli]
MDARNLKKQLVQFINNEILQGDLIMTDEQESKVCAIVQFAFVEGYEDCLKDVREGLMK